HRQAVLFRAGADQVDEVVVAVVEQRQRRLQYADVQVRADLELVGGLGGQPRVAQLEPAGGQVRAVGEQLLGGGRALGAVEGGVHVQALVDLVAQPRGQAGG